MLFPIWKNGRIKEQSMGTGKKEKLNDIKQSINVIYEKYTKFENKIYNQLVEVIQFFKIISKFDFLQIISKIKQIYKILEDEQNFIFGDFEHSLTQLKIKIEENQSGLGALMEVMDNPNNELCYILAFKIVDESLEVIRHLLKGIKLHIKNMGIPELTKALENRRGDLDISIINTDGDEHAKAKLTYEKLNTLKNNYINNSYMLIQKLNEYTGYRAMYSNLYIPLRFGISKFLELSDDEIIPINSLMDEEQIYSKFIEKDTNKTFILNIIKNLPSHQKWNIFLLFLHISLTTFSYAILFIYSSFLSRRISFFLAFLFLGKLFSRYIHTLFLKTLGTKATLIISSLLIIIGSSFTFFDEEEEYIRYEKNRSSLDMEMILNYKDYKHYMLMISRFIIGLGYAQIVYAKYITNNIPKICMKHYIKKYTLYAYFYIPIIGILFAFGFEYLFIKKFQDMCKQILVLNHSNNVYATITIFLNIICILTIIFMFKDLKLEEEIIINQRKLSDSESNNNNDSIDEINLKEDFKLNCIEEDDSDSKSVVSAGRSKYISAKDRRNANSYDAALSVHSLSNDYANSNIVNQMIINTTRKELHNKCSYIHKSFYSYILLYIISSVNNIVLIVSPSLNYNGFIFTKEGEPFDKTTDVQIYSKLNFCTMSTAFLIYIILKKSKKCLNSCLKNTDCYRYIYNNFPFILSLLQVSTHSIILIFIIIRFSNESLLFIILHSLLFPIICITVNVAMIQNCLKWMKKTIPDQFKFLGMNIGTLIHTFENFFNFVGCTFLYFISLKIEANKTVIKIEEKIYIFSVTLSLLGTVIFFFLKLFSIKQLPISRILTRKSYEL